MYFDFLMGFSLANSMWVTELLPKFLDISDLFLDWKPGRISKEAYVIKKI